MKKLILLSIPLLALSCATLDIEDSLNDAGINFQDEKNELITEQGTASAFLPVERVIVEKPIYVPAQEKPPAQPKAGTAAANAAASEGVILPQNYSHAAIIYDYNPDQVYEIYTRPLRVSDIVLQAGEQAVEAPFVSDSERWIIGGGVSYDNGMQVQHIYIKPVSSGLSATLIINTDKRVYHIILRSYSETHMPIVRWRYLSNLPQNFISPQAMSSGSSAVSVASDGSLSGIDPRLLSINYRITYSFFNKPYWLPDLVFDDGKKTYIRLPDLVLQRELPTVFENRNDVLNYRVAGNLIVIDKLIEKISVRIGRFEIAIAKKRR